MTHTEPHEDSQVHLLGIQDLRLGYRAAHGFIIEVASWTSYHLFPLEAYFLLVNSPRLTTDGHDLETAILQYLIQGPSLVL